MERLARASAHELIEHEYPLKEAIVMILSERFLLNPSQIIIKATYQEPDHLIYDVLFEDGK